MYRATSGVGRNEEQQEDTHFLRPRWRAGVERKDSRFDIAGVLAVAKMAAVVPNSC